jgi:hypothetical protein
MKVILNIILKISAIIGAVVVIVSAGSGLYGFASGRIGKMKEMVIETEKARVEKENYENKIDEVGKSVSEILINLNQFAHRQDSANLKFSVDISALNASYILHLKSSERLNELLRLYEIADSLKKKVIIQNMMPRLQLYQ